MSESENVKVVQDAYDSFKRGDIAAVLNAVADDVSWQLPVIDRMRISGTRAGRDEVAKFFSTLAEDQEPLEFEPREYIAQADKVVALGHYEWRVKSTNQTFGSDFVHVFTIRDGSMAEFREYLDTAAATLAYR